MEANEKAGVLVEALPWIMKYHGKIVVIKYGRNITAELDKAEVYDIVFLQQMGMKPVVVHGGGPSITEAMEKSGLKPKFVNGLRVTDEATVKIIGDVYNSLRKGIVNLINKSGGKAKQLKSQDGIISAKQKSPELGYVGEITNIRIGKIIDAINDNSIPVISPLAAGKDNKVYNINADNAAAAIAVALKAEKLTMMTNVDGVMEKGKMITHLSVSDALKKIKEGIINAGMIPKVEACIEAVKHNVPKAHLINGEVKHSLLLEIFTDKGIGTEIVL